MSHISWKALNICKEENNYAISWISNECQLFKKYEVKLTFADSLSASFAQLVWRWSPEKMSRVRISVKSNFSSSLWDGARYHERPKFWWGPAMPSIYGQNCGLKTWALSWHHLHRENAKEFLNDRIPCASAIVTGNWANHLISFPGKFQSSLLQFSQPESDEKELEAKDAWSTKKASTVVMVFPLQL